MLVLHNEGFQPLGQFDGYDSTYLSVKGGEVMTLLAIPLTQSDLAAADVAEDGYVGSPATRPAVTFASATSAPVFLSDDGTSHYGTLFGAVVGGVTGKQSNGPNSYTGAVLGPHTATGSGKITIWDKPGVYGVTLDACDTNSDGLVPTNSSCSVGAKLTWGLVGQLTLQSSAAATAALTTTKYVGRLIEFETNGSLVTTPQNLVAALNSPSGSVSSLQPLSFYQAVFNFYGSDANG